jgi:hypothetical protein
MAMAAAWWWQPAWRRRQQLGGSAILAVAAARLEMRRQHDGGSSNNGVLVAAVWHVLITSFIITMTMKIDYWLFLCCRGGGKGGWEGWLHALLAVVAMNGDDNRNGDCLSKKGVEQGKRREGIERWVCLFSCCLILLLFFGLSFSMQVNWFLPLLLHAAVTIVVKKWLVNSISFFYIL